LTRFIVLYIISLVLLTHCCATPHGVAFSWTPACSED